MTGSGELVHEADGVGALVSCSPKPVEGAGQDKINASLVSLDFSVFNAGVPATNTSSEVTKGWPVM